MLASDSIVRVAIINRAGYEKAPVVMTASFLNGKLATPKVLTNNTLMFTVPFSTSGVFPIRVSVQPTTAAESSAVTTIDISSAQKPVAVTNGIGVYYDTTTRTLTAFNDPSTETSADSRLLSIPTGQVPVVVVNQALQHVFDPSQLTWQNGPGPVCTLEFVDVSGSVVLRLDGVKPNERRALTTGPYTNIRCTADVVNTETGALESVVLTLDGIRPQTTLHKAVNYPRTPGKILQLAFYANADETIVNANGKPSPAVVFHGFGAFAPALSDLPMPPGQQWSAMLITNATSAPVTVHVRQRKAMQPTRLDPFARPKFVVKPGGVYPLVVYPGDTRLLFENGQGSSITVPANKYPYYTDERIDYALPGFEPPVVAQLDSKNNVFYLDIVPAAELGTHVMQMSNVTRFKHRNVYTDAYETKVLPKLSRGTPANISKGAPSTRPPTSSTQGGGGLDGLTIGLIVTAVVFAGGVIGLGFAVSKERKALANLHHDV